MSTLKVVNPANKKVIGEYKVAQAEDVHSAVGRLRHGARLWAATSIETRSKILLSCADALEQKLDDLSNLITSEMGRPLVEARNEVTKSANFFRYFARLGPAALADQVIDIAGHTIPQKSAVIRHTPRGVAGMIKPWNAPVQQLVWAVAPSLIAGCSILMKPSEYAPGSALLFQNALLAGGLPANVYETVVGAADVGTHVASSDVDIISFTGSLATGRKIAELASRGPVRTIMELSGKDVLIVGPSVDDIALVANGIVFGAFSNCGQWCSSIERVFIHEDLYEPILTKVRELTVALRVGDGLCSDIDIGPLANETQFNNVSSLLDDALSKGAQLEAQTKLGDQHKSGFFFPPTVLSGVARTSRIRIENIFGPIVEVQSYQKIDEALDEANRSDYGLGTSVWTNDEQFAEFVANTVDTGMVWINEPMQSMAPCPWSVCKRSGYGVELGEAGVREFTYQKIIQKQMSDNINRRPWYFPY